MIGKPGRLLYVLDSVDDLTDSYHSHGGLVVAGARDLDHARELAVEGISKGVPEWRETPAGPTADEWAKATVFTLAEPPERPSVHIHRDAGCCG